MQQMGIESGELLPHQVTVSSKLNDDFHPHDLSINSATGWVPLIASGNEYVEVLIFLSLAFGTNQESMILFTLW